MPSISAETIAPASSPTTPPRPGHFILLQRGCAAPAGAACAAGRGWGTLALLRRLLVF